VPARVSARIPVNDRGRVPASVLDGGVSGLSAAIGRSPAIQSDTALAGQRSQTAARPSASLRRRQTATPPFLLFSVEKDPVVLDAAA
jgi:hypothetical protein